MRKPPLKKRKRLRIKGKKCEAAAGNLKIPPHRSQDSNLKFQASGKIVTFQEIQDPTDRDFDQPKLTSLHTQPHASSYSVYPKSLS
jgi:hypothetical protein